MDHVKTDIPDSRLGFRTSLRPSQLDVEDETSGDSDYKSDSYSNSMPLARYGHSEIINAIARTSLEPAGLDNLGFTTHGNYYYGQ